MLGLVLGLVVLIALAPLVAEKLRERRLADERRRRGMVEAPPPATATPQPEPEIRPVSDEEWRRISRAVDGPKAPALSGSGGRAARQLRRKAGKAKRKAAEREARAIFRGAPA